MTILARTPGPRRRRRPGRLAIPVAAVLGLTACGLPGEGSVRRVDDDAVPYRLLESETSTAGPSDEGPDLARAPVVYWIDADRLVPEPTTGSCQQEAVVLVHELLDALRGGPSDEARSSGRSSALPSDIGLELVGIRDGTAQVDIEDGTAISADRLPVAIGQVVLTVTSAPGVDAVAMETDGTPIQVPLPGGALTDGPVSGTDYDDLLPAQLRDDAEGCPEP